MRWTRVRSRHPRSPSVLRFLSLLALMPLAVALPRAGQQGELYAQGVTTSGIVGVVTATNGEPLQGVRVVAVHVPSGTRYESVSRDAGVFSIPNVRVGGPYSVTATLIGYGDETKGDLYLSLGQDFRVDFMLEETAIELEALKVQAAEEDVLSSGRTGAATTIPDYAVETLPSIKRSTRDLIRVDPRNDGNYSFGGRNWLYNNITLDGSYFNNSFGLDDPAPGGQTNAEPVPFDAVEQVRVSIAPFDVRQSGFTGANVNTVTKSGTNTLTGSVFTYYRNENLLGNKVSGNKVIANPDLTFNQTGVTLGGPIIRDKLFFFVAGEISRRDDPGTNYVARPGDAPPIFGQSRPEAPVLQAIRDRMEQVYGYETGPFDGFIHATDNDKMLMKLDWNVNPNNQLSLRWNYLNAHRDLPPHPFVLSFNASGRGPNDQSLPSQNSGYRINNNLNSFALELNSRGVTGGWANRFFASYNRGRDNRDPFSEPFPTIDIGEDGVTYTTIGHEPFSIHNILNSDVWQVNEEFTKFLGRHSVTVGAAFEAFGFFNSFNIFRYGLFQLPYFLDFEGDGCPNGSQFATLDEFFAATDPADPIDFRCMIGTGLYKAENIDTGQYSGFIQDEFLVNPRFTLTYGLRVDIPTYFTKPVDNPFSRGLTALDENGNPETVDQSKLPGATPLWSPRVGFNWDVTGDRTTQVRGGTGIFTGRVPFVWVGNVISNPGANPNLYPTAEPIITGDSTTLAQSFDLNAMDSDFRMPQVWTSDIAVDHVLPWNLLGTLEGIYGKDLNAVFMRNADLVLPVAVLADGRPYYGGAGNNELNPDGGAGIYVIDNTDKGWNLSVTAQLRKAFDWGLVLGAAYAYSDARNTLKSTEIASVLWQETPTRGDPNRPDLSYSEFGLRHRISLSGTYTREWNKTLRTSFGLYFNAAEGNEFLNGGNRYSFIYSGDVNGDGYSNDLIYIPRSQDEIRLAPYENADGVTVTAAQQWTALNQFIEQDKYLSAHRGQIAERFGLLNPWFQTLDLRVLQDFVFGAAGRENVIQVSFDVLNLGNLISSSWGVRKVASTFATNPLSCVTDDAGLCTFQDGYPVLNFNMVQKTFIDDPYDLSRWRIQLGLRYMLN